MRRILVSIFAVGAAFTVLASNFVPVTAPESGGEFYAGGVSPARGAAQLSEMQVAARVAPVSVSGTLLASEAPAIPDLGKFSPHVASFSTLDAEPSLFGFTATPLVFAEPFKPATKLVSPRLLAAPRPIVVADVFARTNSSHSIETSLSSAVERRLALTPDHATSRDASRMVAADRTIPGETIASIPFESLPLFPSSAEMFGTFGETHTLSLAVASTTVERTGFEAEMAEARPTAAFLKAAFQPSAPVFTRARFVVGPYSPVTTDSLVGQNASASLDRSVIAADPILSTFPRAELTADPVLPGSIFDRPRWVAEPNLPITSDSLVSSENHVAAINSENLRNRDVEVVQPDTAGSFIPNLVAAIAEVPSNIVQRMNFATLPEAPSVGRTVDQKVANVSTRSAWAVAAEKASAIPKTPVLISGETAMSTDMLKPMSAGPLVDAPLPNENAIASTGYDSTPFDRMIVSPDVPEAITSSRPVLISSKPEFSGDLLKPMNAVSSNPFVGLSKEEILAAARQRQGYCDPNFVGPPIRFSQTVELKLEDLINQLHQRFGVNFILGPNVAGLPLNVKAGSIPWNVLLRSQLFVSGVRARCIDENTIELVENATLPSLQDMADVETRFVKLKFLQRTGSGTVDLANRSQGGQSGNQGGGCGGNNQGGTSGSIQSGGGGQGQGQQGQTVGQQVNNKFDKLIIEIEKILGLRSMQESSVGSQSGQGGGGGTQQQTREAVRSNRFVTQIPGRNILAIRATKEEHELIDQIIQRADRPPFQVVIKGLVYTANQDKLRDIGVSTTLTGGTADNRSNGGIFGDTLGIGTLFDFSTVIGTFDFNVQATAFQQNGVISVKSRPFATVIDGLCTTLDVGRQLPIVIDSTLGGQGDVVFVNAANNLAVTPYVIDDENGDPIAVTLELRLTANDIDSSVTARGVPAISARSIQTQLLLDENKTAILGGFTVDSDSKTVQKTPGLGDIPLIGELFKRRIRDTRVNRLYFAISVDIVPYPEVIRPVDVPGADTQPPSITPEQKKRADSAEPKQVKGP